MLFERETPEYLSPIPIFLLHQQLYICGDPTAMYAKNVYSGSASSREHQEQNWMWSTHV